METAWKMTKALAGLIWALIGMFWCWIQFQIIMRWYGRERIENAFIHGGMRQVRTRDGRIYTLPSGGKIMFTEDKVSVIGPD